MLLLFWSQNQFMKSRCQMFKWRTVDVCQSGEEHPTQSQAERFRSGWMRARKASDLWKKKGWKRERLGWLEEKAEEVDELINSHQMVPWVGVGGQTPIHNNARGHRLWTVALTPLISPPYVRRSLRASAALPQFLFQPQFPQEKAAPDSSYGAEHEIKACVCGTASGPTSGSRRPNSCSESILLSKNDPGSQLKIIKNSFTKKKKNRKSRNAKMPRLK